ncbi:arginase [Thermococcus onnurineus NA1]|uniref:Arginase n=1 Tax=Thermococcus onnurineus (strain NA1) TaxID=523850 RepID=B6YTD3_THEON|nr:MULTISPECIES: arginase family protein [Thermococcus]ACJ15820.1 arginase [Thermococcus onnurineus NA1]NJE46317.1 arginase family protein [Thermococcus sp. GR7]NJE79300.1 arginase family protein [Thermococcus sp. GR4]NJF23804.1 arginase family protein [Thermococcus sp. GR5]
MVTFIPFGEKPNRDGVLYVLQLLRRNKLIEDYMIVESSRVELLAERIPQDKAYIIGDHLATYGIVEKLKPGSLISLDAHTDLMHDYLDHGSWLAYALEEHILNRAVVLAPVLMIPTTERTQLWTRRVKIFPALLRSRKVRGKWRAYKNLQTNSLDEILAETKKYLGDEIYLTIDMDVLKPEYKIARFQHGELSLEELLEILEEIKRRFKIVAFDIAEVSDRIRRSRLGKKAFIEVFQLLMG